VPAVRDVEPAVVRAFSRSRDELALARLPWPNIAVGDALAVESRIVYVLDVIPTPGAVAADALVKVASSR
jgi:hypothetical protein